MGICIPWSDTNFYIQSKPLVSEHKLKGFVSDYSTICSENIQYYYSNPSSVSLLLDS